MKITIPYRFILGIDISKKELVVYLYDHKSGTGHWSAIANDPQGFEALEAWLLKQGVRQTEILFCSEHTGRYAERLQAWSSSQGWAHAVLKTTALQKIGPEYGPKTDPSDARGLAEYGRRYTDQLHLLPAPVDEAQQIKRLQSERRAMVTHRASLKQKRKEKVYHQADMQMIQTCWEEQIAMLTRHIQQLEKRIRQLIAAHPSLEERYGHLRSAPGIGKVLGSFWMGMFATEKQLNPRKISSRFGFASQAYESGSSVHRHARSARFGNSEMRKLMHQSARSVATHHLHYRAYYQDKIAEGKPELLVINNIINKLIRLYCALWNKRVDYDPGYIQKNKHKWKKSA